MKGKGRNNATNPAKKGGENGKDSIIVQGKFPQRLEIWYAIQKTTYNA